MVDAMSFVELSLQSLLHDSGAIFSTYDRYAMEYTLGGRTWYIDVEDGVGEMYFSLPLTPRWDDGTPLTDPEISFARAVIEEACRHWRQKAVFEQMGPRFKGPVERGEIPGK
jgi:hypothetical protein